MKWIKKDKVVWSCLNTTRGMHRTIQTIEEVHVNTVRFVSGTTQQKCMLEQITKWIPIKEYEPVGEVLCLNSYDDWLIGWYDPDANRCENEHELMDDITHWMPKIDLELQ